jgi:hypothetical protein
VSRTNLAQAVEGRRIPVDGGVPGWYGPLGTQVGAFFLFHVGITCRRKESEKEVCCQYHKLCDIYSSCDIC